MSELAIDVAWEQSQCADPLEAATYCSLNIRLGDVPITEVRDDAARTTREVVRVSAYPLAIWLASAWWRLRWEGNRRNADWRLSHQLGAAGGGYTWPHVILESDGESIHVDVRRSPGSVRWEPIAYLNSARRVITASGFEAAVEQFVDKVLARLAETGLADNPLSTLWATVRSEQRDAPLAALRRLEATLGFDAEEAPAALLDVYADGARRFGMEAVAELAALATNGGLPDWGRLSNDLEHGALIHIEDYQESKAQARRAAWQSRPGTNPWERGEAAARAVRSRLGLPRGPLTNDTLAKWLGADLKDATIAGSPHRMAAFARRERTDAADLRVCYRSTHRSGRRFELARLLGDHLIAAGKEDHLLPATRTSTARQKMQRAFAAELLLPWDDLAARIGEAPDDDAIEAAADEYQVSPLVVRTRLVAKRVLPSDALDVD